ncbi:N-acetylmuramoyl-L-alanine amidase [Salibacterium salarium]|uniref:Autolysin n=1 Tax=Salibacterium salarium TaxID=284579 RepID=A0A428MWC0_9BACI|nr:N-acetylmuramoyl-L-alanine amidase [Salibacterium salarium]RSL30431.1 N-acetylmuramoyl-L-alanine amidase [Salibacterium salarium]
MKILNKIGAWTEHRSKLYSTRALSNIDQIVIHHSGTKTGSPQAYARYHVETNNWPGIGYHYVIQPEGTIYKCHAITTVSWHTGNQNTRSIGICLTGDFRQTIPPQKQYSAACELVNTLMESLNLGVKHLKGHRECDGHEGKICPGFSMADFRKQVSGLTKAMYHPTLQMGQRGEEVSVLQQRLERLGFSPGGIDGIFGPRTNKAVEAFQRRNGLSVDGMVGPNTWGVIVEKG